jgi:transcriptional regulator with XRE-family HTH domain
VTSFHFEIGSRARHAGRFIGKVRGELLKALAQRKSEGRLPQQVLAEKLGIKRSLINRQLAGEADISLRSLADLAWAMDMEISFELKQAETRAGQNHPVATSTVRHGQIKYIKGAVEPAPIVARPANSELGQSKKSA